MLNQEPRAKFTFPKISFAVYWLVKPRYDISMPYLTGFGKRLSIIWQEESRKTENKHLGADCAFTIDFKSLYMEPFLAVWRPIC